VLTVLGLAIFMGVLWSKERRRAGADLKSQLV
jgi:hypothetical protein